MEHQFDLWVDLWVDLWAGDPSTALGALNGSWDQLRKAEEAEDAGVLPTPLSVLCDLCG